MNASAVAVSPAADSTAGSPSGLLKALLASAPEYIYFKDRESRFIAVSWSLVEAFGRQSAAEVVGKSDFDFYAPEHARQALEDERKIMRTGQPIFGQLEKECWPTGRVTWALTTKLPLRNRRREIVGTFGISKDVTATRQLEAELEQAHRDLVDASRVAGMAEVATGVLHNVGNVLNSLNVSASVIATGLRQSKAETLRRIADLLRLHESDLGAFLSTDPKGLRVPDLLTSLAQHTTQERDRLQQELSALQRNIDHIKEIIAMQQAYATMVGVVEALDPRLLMEDAVRMNAAAIDPRKITLTRAYENVPHVVGEQAKILQILVNLIRNANHACLESDTVEKRITVKLEAPSPDRVHLTVEDNGVGIPDENLTRIFQHGFTTRKTGHGFGLHSAANAAHEMKGRLFVSSGGRGKGATFTLELPAAPQPGRSA